MDGSEPGTVKGLMAASIWAQPSAHLEASAKLRPSFSRNAGNKEKPKSRSGPPFPSDSTKTPKSTRPSTPPHRHEAGARTPPTTSVMLLIRKHFLHLHQRQKLTSSCGRQILFAESGRRKGVSCSPDHKSTDERTGAGGGGWVWGGTSCSALLRAPGLRCGA